MDVNSDFLRDLLKNRGLLKEKDIDIFLNPNYTNHMHDPFSMRDMGIVCDRIYSAILNNEKIIIYADYDADGIPGAVILSDLFKKINFYNYEVYIPSRNEEGYGLNKEAILKFIDTKVNLIITIDLGITAIEEVTLANQNNIDVIIMDHHIPHEELPLAFGILNPKVDDYKEKMLCGAGVVFKFVQGFLKKYSREFNINEGWEKWLLDMAGLATLSDMVPLLGENRIIAYFGLLVFKKSPRLGLVELLKKLRIDQRHLVEDDITFMVTPKLNSASRMDLPIRAFELLSTNSQREAGELSSYLLKINDDRKNLVLSIMKEVKKSLEKRNSIDEKEIIVIGNPKWKIGVLGIVASKIVEQYEKTVFVWGEDENGFIKGSCRSKGDISLVELMHESKDFFIEYGGHEEAGGFSLIRDKIHFLEDSLSASFLKLKKERNNKDINYDMKIDLGDVNIKNYKDIRKLAPFGLGNPKPIFLFNGIFIYKIRQFGKNGKNEHLEIIFTDGKYKIKGISFFADLNSFSVLLEEDRKVNLLASFDMSYYQGKSELRLKIIDIM